MFKNKIFNVISDIDKLHLKFCKRIKRLPMSVKISTLIYKYWLRINSPDYKKQLVGKAVHAGVPIQSGCEIL